MHSLRRAGVLFTALFALLPTASFAQAPPDVPRDHWAYTAVEELARKGLVKGYPPDGRFFGPRTVTRYEMASILQRILTRVDELLAQKADKAATAPTTGVMPAQLEAIQKLVEEFRNELIVMRTDMKRVSDDLEQLKTEVAQLKGQVDKNTADIAANKQGVRSAIDAINEQAGRVDKLNKQVTAHTISGYIQGRFESFDQGRTSLFSPTAAGGTGQTPTIGGPAVGGPFYGFLVRRARLKVSGPISHQTTYGMQLDLPSITSVNVKEAYISIADVPAKNVTLTAGQFAPPFGYELPNSSAVRESPERAFAFSDTTQSAQIFKTTVNATGGVVTPGSVLPLFLNQEYDQGLMLTFGAPHFISPATKFFLMALNGGGTIPAGIRNQKNGLDVIGRAQTTVADGRLDLGVSGYYGQLPVRSAPPNAAGAVAPFVLGLKELAGVDLNYHAPWGTTMRAEYVGGVYETTPDRALYLENNHAQSWYFSARHLLSRKLELAVKYDEFMPITQQGKFAAGYGRVTLTRKTLQGGLLYYLDDATRLRLWYQRGLSPYDISVPAGPLHGQLGLLVGEVQVRL